MPSYRHISSSLLAAAVLAGASLAGAAEPPYPARPVRIVVPYAPGGGSDATARLLGQKLGERLGQTFVIGNPALRPATVLNSVEYFRYISHCDAPAVTVQIRAGASPQLGSMRPHAGSRTAVS